MARGAALAFAVALGATLGMAAPVAFAPCERLFGSSRTFAREDPNRDPFVVMEQFRTERVPGPYLQPLTDLPGRVVTRLVGPVAAFNLLILATFPLSAAAAYLLARYVLGSHPGAMVAGLAYAFLPFHVAHATNHPHVAQTQWLPLYFLALWRCLDRTDLRRASFLLASAAAVALSDFYGGLIAAVLSPVALVAYGVVAPRQGERRLRRLVLTSLTLAVAAAAGLLLIQRVTPAVLLRPGSFAFPRSDLFLYSAKWWSYLIPAVDHPLAESQIRQFWVARGLEGAILEQQVGLGWSLIVLGAVPLCLWLRGDRSSLAHRSAPVLATVAVAALLCSLSPERRIGSFTFVRPSAVLYEVAPMFRAYARFGVVVGLMATLLAGGGATCLWRWPGSAGRRAAALLLALAALEYAPFPPWRWRDVLPTRAHRWLAGQPGPLRVLDCVPPRVSDIFALGLFPHEVSLLGGGFVRRGGRNEFVGATSFDDCREPQLGHKLAALGYTHVVVRRDNPAGRWTAGGPAPAGLAPGPEFEDGWILEVKAEPPRAYVSAWLGFHPREYSGEATWRWMEQTGAMRGAATRESVGMVLVLELKAFPRERRVETGLNGRRLGELEVTADWGWYEIPLGPLARGENTLTLACRGPSAVADDILGNRDFRALGLAVGSWRIKDAGGGRGARPRASPGARHRRVLPTMAPAPAPIPTVAASLLWVSPAVMSTGVAPMECSLPRRTSVSKSKARRARVLTRPDGTAAVTRPRTSPPAGTTTFCPTLTSSASQATTRSPDRLVAAANPRPAPRHGRAHPSPEPRQPRAGPAHPLPARPAAFFSALSAWLLETQRRPTGGSAGGPGGGALSRKAVAGTEPTTTSRGCSARRSNSPQPRA